MDNRTSVLATSIVLLIALACGEIDPGETKNQHTCFKDLNRNVSVAIIGAGFSGLSAFERLKSAGFTQIDLFEASSRIGGRVYSVPFENGFLQHGAQFINGADNPIYKMAIRLGLVTGELEDDSLFENANYQTGQCKIDTNQVEEFGRFVSHLEDDYHQIAKDPLSWNTTVGVLYDASYRSFINSRERTSTEIRTFEALSRFYKTYYEGEWSSYIDKLSLKNFFSWDDNTEDKASSYTLNKYGYTAILNELSKNLLPIHLNSKISLIDYSGEKIRLKMIDGQFHPIEYDYVISTIPLGHLKAHAKHLFHPRLPQRKLEAINAFGFGSLLKIFLVYDKPFWTKNTTSLMPIFVEGCSSESYLSKELHTFEVLDWNPNVLVGWLSGDGPKNIDNLSDEELTKYVTRHFRESMPGVNIPMPKRLIRTSWLRDDNFRGSYTYITPEAAKLQADPFELLARPVYLNKKPRVLFAGEATHSRIYQTTIGAYLSGRREADRLINYASRCVDSKPLKTTIPLMSTFPNKQ